MGARSAVVDRLHNDITMLVDRWYDRDDDRHPGLLWQLAAHSQPVRMASVEHHGKTTKQGSRPPWDAETAGLLSDVAAGARRLERELLAELTGKLRGVRPGTDRHTVAALRNVATYCEVLVDRPRAEPLVAAVAGDLNEDGRYRRGRVGQWVRDALLLLGAERRWAHVRTASGLGRCPYCLTPVRVQPDLVDFGDPERWTAHAVPLAYDAERGHVVCPNRDCRDELGERYTWPLGVTLAGLLVFDVRVLASECSSPVELGASPACPETAA